MNDHPLRAREQDGALAIAPVVVLLGLVAVSAVVRAVLAREIPVPFIFGDELLHGELARSVREGSGYLVRGHWITISFVYPAAVAPAWLFGSTETVYAWLKTFNAVLMSLAAVPVFCWGRRFLSTRGALVAAGLSLLLPAFVLTGTLMTENAFYPAFVLALLAIAVCVERPTLAHQAWAVGGLALAGAARLQGLVLVGVVPAAVVADRLLARGPREVWRALWRLWPLGAACVAAGILYIGAKLAAGSDVGALGVYSGQAPTNYSLWGVLRWSVYALGELTLTTALAPVAALLLLLTLPPRGEAERAFLATGTAAILALVTLAGFAEFWNPPGLKDRYLFHAVPVLFLALVLWIERGLPRPARRTAAAVVACVGLVALLPLKELLSNPTLVGNGVSLVVFRRVSETLGGTGALRVGIAAGAVLVGVVFALAPRRIAPAALVGALAVLMLLSTVSLSRAMAAQARGVRDLAALGSDPQWIDARVGAGADVAYVNATQYEAESALHDWWPLWVPVWESEFFNRSLDASIGLGLREPIPAHEAAGQLDWATGRIAGASPRYAVTDPRFAVAGRKLASTPWLVLYSAAAPLRLASAVEGVYRDGWSGSRAAFDRWAPAGRQAEVTVARDPGHGGKVTVSSGPLASQGQGAALGGLTAQQVVTVPGGRTRVVRIDVPPAPYRIEVAVPDTFVGSGGRDLGAHVSFRAVGAT